MVDSPSLALRYYACDACGTVFALPDVTDEPTACGQCGAGPLRELRDGRNRDAYFAP